MGSLLIKLSSLILMISLWWEKAYLCHPHFIDENTGYKRVPHPHQVPTSRGVGTQPEVMGSSGHHHVVMWHCTVLGRGDDPGLLGRPTCHFRTLAFPVGSGSARECWHSTRGAGSGGPTFQHRKERAHLIHRDLQDTDIRLNSGTPHTQV